MPNPKIPDEDKPPMPSPGWSPEIEEPDPDLPVEVPNPNPDENEDAPLHAKTSGAPLEGKEPLVNPSADRNTEGVRQAGMTPRPTDKPITGGDRG